MDNDTNRLEISIENQFIQIIKSTDERIVTGVPLVPDIPDTQGDIISKEEIRKAAHKFMFKRTMGIQHQQENKNIHIMESYIAPQKIKINGYDVPEGSWVLSVFVNDDEVWKKVKNEGFDGFSIGGTGMRSKIED